MLIQVGELKMLIQVGNMCPGCVTWLSMEVRCLKVR